MIEVLSELARMGIALVYAPPVSLHSVSQIEPQREIQTQHEAVRFKQWSRPGQAQIVQKLIASARPGSLESPDGRQPIPRHG